MHNHAPQNYACPFCLVARQIKNDHVYTVDSDIVYRTQAITAMIGSHQWANNKGHVIIIPNEHFENIYDLPIRFAAQIHEAAQKVALAMKAAYRCDGISTRQHNEPAGNQDVWHYHLHVFPRYRNDNLYATPRGGVMPVEERAKYAKQLKSQLLV
jgi:histidine triad (HIT) family protein